MKYIENSWAILAQFESQAEFPDTAEWEQIVEEVKEDENAREGKAAAELERLDVLMQARPGAMPSKMQLIGELTSDIFSEMEFAYLETIRVDYPLPTKGQPRSKDWETFWIQNSEKWINAVERYWKRVVSRLRLLWSEMLPEAEAARAKGRAHPNRWMLDYLSRIEYYSVRNRGVAYPTMTRSHVADVNDVLTSIDPAIQEVSF